MSPIGNEIEAMNAARRRMLLGFLAGYLAWQVPTVLSDIIADVMPGWVDVGTTLLALVAGAVGAWYGVGLARLNRSIRLDPRAAAALDDERIRHLRGRSYSFGFWVLGGYLVGLRLLAFFAQADSSVASQLGVMLAIGAPLGRFLYLDRE